MKKLYRLSSSPWAKPTNSIFIPNHVLSARTLRLKSGLKNRYTVLSRLFSELKLEIRAIIFIERLYFYESQKMTIPFVIFWSSRFMIASDICYSEPLECEAIQFNIP